MPSFARFEDVTKWLASQSRDINVMFAARAALRAAPAIAIDFNPSETIGSRGRPTTILKMFRGLAGAWSMSAFGEGRDELRAAAAAAATGATQEHYCQSAAEYACVTATVDEGIARSYAVRAIDCAIEASAALGRTAFETSIRAFAADAELVRRGVKPDVVAVSKLWSPTTPKWVGSNWRELKSALLREDTYWAVWTDWYDARLLGLVSNRSLEMARLVKVDKEAWTWRPSDTNRLIRKLLVQEGSIIDSSIPDIPPSRPAAIEPVWRNGRLTLPNSPAKSDLDGRKFMAALKTLRTEMNALADAASGEANIDRRFVSHVRQLAKQIPSRLPRQQELFMLGHAETVFSGYANTVNDQWPDFLAARYHALALHYDRTMRQSPLWREFKRNAARYTLTPQQRSAAVSLAAETTAALRHEETTALVDPAVPQLIDQLAVPLRSNISHGHESTEDVVDAGLDLLAYDVVESINNTFKSVVQAAMWASLSETVKEASSTFTAEARKSIVKEARRLGREVGPGITKWTKRVLLTAAVVGTPLVVGLTAAFPEMFAWLRSAAAFLRLR